MPTVGEALQLGWRQHQSGDLGNAEQIYRQVLAVASANADAWCLLGMVCHDQGRFDEAVEAYHKAIDAQPNNPVALSNLGNTLKQQGKLKEAEASCRKALELKPDYSTAYYNLGVALEAQGHLEEATETFEQARANVPNDVAVQSNVSAALVRQGKHNEAEVNSTRIVESGFNCMKQSRYGWMLYNQHDMYIGKSLDLYGEFSEGEVAMFERIVRSGDTVVEAGANIGTHTVALSKMVGPQGTVIAFEPQRIVFQTLCANVAINSLANVHCQYAALGAELGEIIVPWLAPDAEANFGGLELGAYKNGEPVTLKTLDSFSIESCRLLKIDVEGMEESVLRGGHDLITRCQPFMYIENDREDRSAALIKWLLDANYQLYWHLLPLFNDDNYFGNAENAFDKIISVNMLCIPANEAFDVEGLTPITNPQNTWRDSHP